MRLPGHIALIVPALCVALTSPPVLADVEVDLSAIGARTDADARIAPGKAPVQLRYPGETHSAHATCIRPPIRRTAKNPGTSGRDSCRGPAGSAHTFGANRRALVLSDHPDAPTRQS